MSDPINLGARRAAKDGTKWTPSEALRKILSDIESGDVVTDGVAVIVRVPTSPENFHVLTVQAGMSSAEIHHTLGIAMHHLVSGE